MLFVSNLLVFSIGSALTVLSFRAHRRFDGDNFRYTTVGFGLITASTIVEASYAPGIANTGVLTSDQLLVFYTVESVLIGLGLASIAYSVLRY